MDFRQYIEEHPDQWQLVGTLRHLLGDEEAWSVLMEAKALNKEIFLQTGLEGQDFVRVLFVNKEENPPEYY